MQTRICNCGGLTKCSFESVENSDSIDYFDQYTKLCQKCGCKESTLVPAGNIQQEYRHTSCPYCGESSAHHISSLAQDNTLTAKKLSLIEDIFRKKLTKTFSDLLQTNKGFNVSIINETCPKCHSLVFCAYYFEMSNEYTYDTFEHVCMNIDCDYTERKEYSTQNYCEYTQSLCGLCHRNPERT